MLIGQDVEYLSLYGGDFKKLESFVGIGLDWIGLRCRSKRLVDLRNQF